MNKFKCPKCHVISDKFNVNNNEQEKLNDEKNYNEKVEKFKKIIEEHNNNITEECYEEEIVTTYTLGLFPHNEKIKKRKEFYTWKLYNLEGREVDGRTALFCGITDYPKLCILLDMAHPLNKNYEVIKYDKYKFIECANCGFKQYF